MKQSETFQGNNIQRCRTESFNILIIILLWILMSVLVNPVGNFPLNDDWVYGRAAQSVLAKSGFTLAGGNTSANLVAQAYWGALFCLPFGFSFTALRISTLVLGFLGVLATYGLLQEVSKNKGISLLGATLVAVNPIYFALSNTFMTDVPFFALAVTALYLFVKGFKKNQNILLILGVILLYFSLFVRQNAIILLVAFGLAYLAKKGTNKINLLAAFFPALFGFGLQIAYQKWLEVTSRTSPNFNLQSHGLIQTILSGHIKSTVINFLNNTSGALIYIGLFTAPFIFIIFFKIHHLLSRAAKKSTILIALALLTPILLFTAKNHKLMPLGDNILLRFGVGPLTLHDTYILNTNYPNVPGALKFAWVILTIIGILAAALLAYSLVLYSIGIFQKSESANSNNSKWLKILVVSSIIFYYLPFGIIGYFDRYLLILIPLFMVVVADYFSQVNPKHLSKFNSLSSSLLLLFMLVYAGFSIGATHDYLSWNQARWQALENLLTVKKVPMNYIDGGYEFNGWYLYNPKDTYSIKFTKNPKKINQSWWYVDKDDYMIAFGDVKGYEQVERYSTHQWLPFGPEKILVLHKKT